MASIFKPSYTKLDKATGERVKKTLSKWYVKYRDAKGIERKVPGFTDKAATLQLAAKLEREAQQESLGLVDPFERHRTRPLTAHLDEFESHLRDKGNGDHHVQQTADRARRIVAWCKFRFISDVNASNVEAYLADLRDRGRSRQTSNHYLAAMKEFCRWLVLDRRTGDDPIQHLKRLNVSTDRRHDRRALDSDEFAKLLEAAEAGTSVQGVDGPDRAMLYVMAAWTGFRRGELASLTIRSLDLDGETPTVRVEAAYSKRRRTDEVPLHLEVVERLKKWLTSRPDIASDEPLFPLKTSKGHFRRTAKMMRADLERARTKWIEESPTPEEKQRREESSFLTYRNEDGLFADFHANRHTFITNLGRAGVSPKDAQTLARHSDINLTMGIYSHVGVSDQAVAVSRLPGPPSMERPRCLDDIRATGTDPRHVHQHVQTSVSDRPRLSAGDTDGGRNDGGEGSKKNDVPGSFDPVWQSSSLSDAAHRKARETGRPLSSEPRVGGSNPSGCTRPKPFRFHGMEILPAWAARPLRPEFLRNLRRNRFKESALCLARPLSRSATTRHSVRASSGSTVAIAILESTGSPRATPSTSGTSPSGVQGSRSPPLHRRDDR